jgi:hypothetical protein
MLTNLSHSREYKKLLDSRWKKVDRFEASVNAALEMKHSWRRKLSAKEGECEALKVRLLDHPLSQIEVDGSYFPSGD